MSDTSRHPFDESGHWFPRPNRSKGSRIVLVAEPYLLRSYGEGLAIHGYETAGYTYGIVTREYLGKLATHIVDRQPDAVVTFVHSDAQDIFLNRLDGAVPLVALDSARLDEEVGTSPTTQVLCGPFLPSKVAQAVHQVIEAARQAQE